MNSLGKNTIYNAIKTVSTTLFPLIAFPYATRMLLVDSLGKVNFGLSIISYFSLIASLGINVYAIRECSKVRRDPEKLSTTASQIFTINCISTIISYALLALTLLLASPLENYRTLIILQSISIAASTIGADWLNNVFEDFKFIAIRTIAFQFLSIFLLFLLVHNPNDYLIYAGITVVSNSGASIVNIIYRRRFCHLRVVFPIHLKRHLAPILLLFGMQVSQIFFVNSDQTILGLAKGDYDVGIYSLAVNVYTMVNTLIASIAWVVMPRLSIGFEERDYGAVNATLSYAAKFIITFGSPLVIGLIVLGPEIIWFLGGSDFEPSVHPLRILAIALAASYVSGFFINIIMLPSGREKIVFISSAVCALVNVALNIFLIPQFGYIAAAWTTVVAEVIGIIIVVPFVEKEIRLSGLTKTCISSLVGIGSIWIVGIVSNILFADPLVRMITSITASLVMYLVISILLKNDLVVGALEIVRSKINLWRKQ